MLPSMGYFSAIPCVFYLAGNCERPHCHYRHCIKDKTDNGEVVSSNVSSEKADWLGPNLSVSMVTTMVEKLVDKIFVEEPEKTQKLDRDQVVREALHRLKKESVLKKIPHASPSTSAFSGIPAYKPTPISELNKRHIPVVYAPAKPQMTIRHEKAIEEKLRPSSPSTVPFNRHYSESETMLGNNPADGTISSINKNEIVNMDFSPSELQTSLPLTLGNYVVSDALREETFFPSSNHCISYTEKSPVLFAVDPPKPFDTSNETTQMNGESRITIPPILPHVNEPPIDICKMEISTEACFEKKRTLNSAEKILKDLSESASVEKDHKHNFDSKSTTELKAAKNMVSSLKSKHSHDVNKLKHGTKDKQYKKSSSHKEKYDSRKGKQISERSLYSKSTSDKKANDSKVMAAYDVKKTTEKSSSSTGYSKKHVDKNKDKKREKHHSHKYKYHDSHSKKAESEAKHYTGESGFDKLLGKTTHKSSSSSSKDKSSSHSLSSKSTTSANPPLKSSSSSNIKHNQDEPPRKKPKLDTEGESSIKNHRTESKLTTEKQDPKKSSYSSDLKQESFVNKTSKESSKRIKTDHGHHSQLLNGQLPIAIQDTEESDGYDWRQLDGAWFDSISISSESSLSPHHMELSSDEVLSKFNKLNDAVRSDCLPDSRWSKAKEIIQKNSGTKIRIAHVPNVSNILSAKTKILANTHTAPDLVVKSGSKMDGPYPVVQRRIAHASEIGSKKKGPNVVSHPDANKIAFSIRHQYCKALLMELEKWYSGTEALQKAEEEELDIAKKSNSVQIYKNLCSLLLLKIRKNQGRLDEGVSQSRSVGNLSPASTPDYTFGWTLYKCFAKYLLSKEEKIQNGYPMPLPGFKNCAYIEKSARRFSIQQPAEPHNKICSNCGKTYQIDEEGMPTTTNDCFYHWGRLRKFRVMGQISEKFTCCDGADDAVPCQSSTYHVWSGFREDCMLGFVNTREFPSTHDEASAGVFALDCEMCYTTKGLELARLTVVNLNEEIVFDQVVAMKNPILDYCTRFSGIDEEKVASATYTFADVREWILNNIFDKTILVGHSLENDLKALMIFHDNVVDTSVVFPHKYGPPLKCSLKHLATSVLSMTIQDSDKGHDSKEDAITCLKLMMLKIKDDAKARKPRFIIGYSGKK